MRIRVWVTALLVLCAAVGPSRNAEAQAKTKRSRDTAPAIKVADYTSRNFLVRTDLPADEARDLLKRLESMIGLVEKYFGQKLRSPIGMIVVKDLEAWPAEMLRLFDPGAVESIRGGGGVTFSRTRASVQTGQVLDSKAIVYATADRGTPQHEAVHAYCILTFGRTGPTWYSEGMAEIGQYWSEDRLGVYCHDVVLQYLKSEQPKLLEEIVDSGEQTGDSWQNYAWRWVLCHMLANNPNYAARFKPLGLGLLNGRSISFATVYGSMEREINFEYQFFLKHIDTGYRADLCAWDWKAKYVACRGGMPLTSRIEAQRGWQASRATLEAGVEYDYAASGTWKTSADGDSLTADGSEAGTGRLLGIIFDDYALSEPFELGAYGSFTAPRSGNLLLRCQDRWNELADNTGKLQVRIKVTGRGNPLPHPEAKSVAGDVVKKSTEDKKKSARVPPASKSIKPPAGAPSDDR